MIMYSGWGMQIQYRKKNSKILFYSNEKTISDFQEIV